MNSRQLQYAILLAKELNFSQVAEKLNISQPALSKQIHQLEEELGVKLFDRQTSPISLTAAGEVFMKDAREILFREEQLRRKMQEYGTEEKGRLIIGISPFRSFYQLPAIIKKLRDEFDGLKIIVKELSGKPLSDSAIAGEFDIAVMNLPVDRSLLDVYPMEEESVVLAVSEKLSHLITKTTIHGGIEEVDIKTIESLPFVVLSKTQLLRQLFDSICSEEGISPTDITEVVSVTTAWSMVHSGVGATLLPLSFANDERFHDGIKYYKIKNLTSLRHPAVVTKKGQHISKYARYAIKLLTGK